MYEANHSCFERLFHSFTVSRFFLPPFSETSSLSIEPLNKTKHLFFCAKGDVIKVNKAFRGRVMLPGYAASPLNGTMEISSLRTNDSGTYRCQIVMDNLYERDSVPMVVSGKSSSGSTSSETQAKQP